MYKIKSKPEDFIVNEISSFEKVDGGRYVYFVLTKKNYTTIRALGHIARGVGISIKNFGFAGTKDKLAVTSQLVSVEGVSADKLTSLNLKDIIIEVKGRSDKYLSLGELEGNKFELVVRDLNKDENDKFREKIKSVVKVPNYFGEQRFSKNNIEVGKSIVKKDFKQAVDLILENVGDTEKKVRRYLEKKSNDYVGALREINKKILRMYVHAYQSYLWNECVKEIVVDHVGVNELPIIGFGTELDIDVVAKIVDRENINLRDFIIRSIPELSAEGDIRDVFISVKDLDIIDEGVDFVTIRFTLPKGSYATVVIKELFS